MDPETGRSDSLADPRVYYAAERTLLAWVRTGLAMMGFGFIVARFTLFLREIAAVHPASPPQQQGLSLWLGTVLVIFGAVLNLCAAFKHVHAVRRLEKGQPLRFHSVSLGVFVALLLVLVGFVMVAYLLFGLPIPQ